ncbi:putative pyruvate, phosphate dikinase regulatory protein [Kaistia sp. 32K]|uniref:pyruvate, water dikinase regulatory protein n=1 Tax=Kaistia sp. 32K TaxID=2795690 RepID=UPI00191529B6|nr:pyruvate, water dikinase regulatory protein [Kaistia sp. 32K]BCP55793.1 putative pyruvate, phosphate dikinase regulatory protein [Kaistia sp. 32K]
MKNESRHLHLHLISDATGETLLTVGRAASAQYPGVSVIEHMHSMVRAPKQIDQLLVEIEREPGIILYTLVDRVMAAMLEQGCRDIGVPCFSVLDPVLQVFQSYLGASSEGRAGAQHSLDGDYFRRIEALTFTMMHDDGQLPEDLDLAEIVIIGVSRTSKTPTSIYLANRGVRTANIPIVPGIGLPAELEAASHPLIVGLVATPDRIVQMRENRVLSNAAFGSEDDPYVDRAAVANEIAATRKICARNGWPVIDVTRRSIEETAAAILALRNKQAGTLREAGIRDGLSS